MHARCTSLFLSTDPLFQPNTQWAVCSKTTDGEPPHLQNMMLRDFYFFNATDGGPLVLVEESHACVLVSSNVLFHGTHQWLSQWRWLHHQ
jgi:hypothetical protein